TRRMSKTRSSLKGRTTIALLIAAVTALVAVAPGVASKGGNKGSNSAQSTGAWVSATPNPATVGGHVNLAGCGYQFEKPLSLVITKPAGTSGTYGILLWSSGCLDTASFIADQAGTYTVQVFQGGTAPVASTSVTAS